MSAQRLFEQGKVGTDAKKLIPFLHRYHKLSQPVFTTIRGKTWLKKFRVGEVAEVVERHGNFTVTVEAAELRRVRDMPLQFLKDDAEYPGFVIRSAQDFIDLLNSFRAPSWQQVDESSEMTVLTLRRL